MQIGFTSTSFRQIKSIEKVVKIAAESGVDCIEWGGDIHVKNLENAQLAKKLCDRAGIKVSSYGSYYRVGSCNTAEWENICRIASATGAKSVRVWLGDKDSEKTDASTYEKLVSDAKKICRIANDFGLTVCPECHDNTFNNNTDAFLKIHGDVAFDNFRTYFQSHYRRLDYDLDRIERTLPFTESVHISYSEQSREQFPKFDPTYIDKLLSKILSSGFDGNLLVEYTYLFCWAGLSASMKKDVAKIRAKVEKAK